MKIRLTARAFDVLVHLVEHRDRVVGKDELLAAVWRGRVVEENNLTQAISAVRRAFGTDAGDQRFIVTVPGRGYRFVAEVEPPAEPTRAAPDVPGDKARVAGKAARRVWAGVAVVVLLAGAMAVVAWQQRPPRAGAADRTVPVTLAVLPFRPIGGARDEMLELGMAETLIARLSRATTLRVLALGSVQSFAGRPPDPLRAGLALDADYVLDGSTQQRGQLVRINARLLSLPDGRTVWAGTFDQRPEQVFMLQDALAEGVASALSQAYAAPVRSSPCDGGDADAYRAYLRGRHLINRPNPLTLGDAIASFEEAIHRDPQCARAWAGIAFAHRALVVTGDREPVRQFALSNAAIARALAIDPASAEAYAAKGFNQFWHDWDWPGAETSLRHAIALNRNLPDAHFALAHLLNNIGRHREALEQAHEAMRLDPLSPLVNALAAGFAANAGEVDEMRQRLDMVLEHEPDFWIARMMRGQMAITAGDEELALRHLQRAIALTGGNSQSQMNLGMAYVRLKRRDDALRIVRLLEALDRTGYVAPGNIASLYAMLGDRKQALDLWERGYRERDIGMAFLRNWRTMFRGEPRYGALMARLHLPIEEETPLGDRPD